MKIALVQQSVTADIDNNLERGLAAMEEAAANGVKLVSHSRYITFQMAEVSFRGEMIAEILQRIDRLRCCSVGW